MGEGTCASTKKSTWQNLMTAQRKTLLSLSNIKLYISFTRMALIQPQSDLALECVLSQQGIENSCSVMRRPIQFNEDQVAPTKVHESHHKRSNLIK